MRCSFASDRSLNKISALSTPFVSSQDKLDNPAQLIAGSNLDILTSHTQVLHQSDVIEKLNIKSLTIYRKRSKSITLVLVNIFLSSSFGYLFRSVGFKIIYKMR